MGLPMTPFQAKIVNWEGKQFAGQWIQGVLAPRGSGKSEVGTIGDCTHEICYDPELTSQIIAESEGTACVFLSAIRQHLERNPLILSCFGKHESEKEWSITRITSAQRKSIKKEPTVQCLGAAGRIVGRHVRIQWCDDLVSLTNSATEETRKKLKHWYSTALCPILDPGGFQRIRGTRYFQKDLYYSLLKMYGESAFLKIPALYYDDTFVDTCAMPQGDIEFQGPEGIIKFNSQGLSCLYPQSYEHSYWPERFPLWVLLQLRMKDVISFNTQYQNNTNVLKSELLNEGALVVAKESEIPPIDKLVCYQGVDPARKASGDGCLFSITTIGVDKWTGLIYILRQTDRKLADPDLMCKFIVGEYYWIKRLGGTIQAIGIESNAFQGILATSIRANPKEYGVLPITPKNTGKDKEMRFINVSKYFNMGHVRFHPSCAKLLEDVAEFPDCDLKDRVDSMMHAFEVFEMGGSKFLGFDMDITRWIGTGSETQVLDLFG